MSRGGIALLSYDAEHSRRYVAGAEALLLDPLVEGRLDETISLQDLRAALNTDRFGRLGACRAVWSALEAKLRRSSKAPGVKIGALLDWLLPPGARVALRVQADGVSISLHVDARSTIRAERVSSRFSFAAAR